MVHLDENKLYRVLLIDGNYWYRIICETYDPAYFPVYAFDITDNTIDDIWIKISDDNTEYMGPEVFCYNEHFFEDWFDDKEEERKVLDLFLIQHPEYLPTQNIKDWFTFRVNELTDLINFREEYYITEYNWIKKIYDEMREQGTSYQYYKDRTFDSVIDNIKKTINNLKQKLVDLNKFLDENPQYKL